MGIPKRPSNAMLHAVACAPGPGSSDPGPGLAWFMIKLDSMCMFTDKKNAECNGEAEEKAAAAKPVFES